jgi:uncharacterized protein YggE
MVARRFAVSLLLPLCGSLMAIPAGMARAEVQLRCDGTLLEARGQAERERPVARLRLNLSLEAEAAGNDAALAELQRRLAAVRSALQALEVRELRVDAPSTWPRPAQRGRPAAVQAQLSLTGLLAPARLQELIRQVGALPGVRLAPAQAEADPAQNRQARRLLLQAALGDAREQAAEIATALGRPRLDPLEVQLDGSGPMPQMAPMLAKTADAVPPFDPAELSRPRDRLSLLVRFCAR